MASFTRAFFFLSTLLLLSMQIHARESHFFSKFPRGSSEETNPSFVPVEATDKTSLPKKDQDNQDPSFVPQSGNGYGLYGHETTYNKKNEDFNDNNKKNEDFNNDNNNNEKYEENVTYEPYTTPSLSQTEESYNYEKYPKNRESYDNTYSYNNNNEGDKRSENYYNNNNYNYNMNAFETEKEPQRFTDRGYNSYSNNAAERQGMSDTRFMDNGKYFFDTEDEKNHGHYYAKQYKYRPGSSRNYDSYGQNNGGSFYGNNENGFKDPYDSKWEKNFTNEQQEEFGEEPRDHFRP